MKKLVLLCIVALLFASCQSIPQNNSSNFEYYELENGIPLIVYKTDSSKIVSLQINVHGGTAFLEPEYSGLESALFNMMTMGSELYTPDMIRSSLYSTQGSIYASSNQLGSTLGLVSIDYYFDDLLSIFIDGFLNPSFPEDEYTTYMTSTAQGLQYRMQNPNNLLTENIVLERYKNHPYETSSRVTNESINNITIEAMKEHLQVVHNAERLTITAVGNFSGRDLVSKLNDTIGSLQTNSFSPIDVPLLIHGGEPIIQGVQGAQGSGYVAYTVSAPVPGSEEEMANAIATDIYSELLFNLVREHYGSTYSIGATYVYSKAPYNMVRAYQVSDLENISTYILEAENLLKEDKLISGKDEDGEFTYSTIEERLEGYKNTLINSQYYSSQTNSAVAAQISTSLLLYNNAEAHLDFTERVRKVSAEDVKRVFNDYWVEGEKQWFAVTGIGEERRFLINN